MRVGLRRLSTAVAREADGAARLLQGARPLVQPHSLRPQGTIDMLTGRPVKATNESLGIELPNVDLTQDFSFEECEVLKQASDDAGGIVVFTNQKDTLDIHGHRRFAKTMADSENTTIERQPVVAGHPDEGDVMEIVREADANVVFGENWHSDHSFMDYTASYSILRCAALAATCYAPHASPAVPAASAGASRPSSPVLGRGAVVPRLGVNDTLFSSTEDAFDGLSQTMQNLILDLNAFHSANKAYGAGHPGNSRAAMEGTDTMTWKVRRPHLPLPSPRRKSGTSSPPRHRLPSGRPPTRPPPVPRLRQDDAPILEADVLQPVVSVHPRTGRRGIYVSPTFTTHIDGAPPPSRGARGVSRPEPPPRRRTRRPALS